MKRSETSIAHSLEYFIVFNFEDIWHDTIDKSINDETLLAMSANKRKTRKCRKKETHRRRKSRNSRRWRANRVFHRDMCCWKCFEFDRFESKWDRRIEVWRNARLYEIRFAIASVSDFRKRRAHLVSLQIKKTRLFNEHVKQIVHDEVESRWCRWSRRSERSKRTNDCWFLHEFVCRFECRNRETRELECNDRSWDNFCSRYRFLWCCNRQEFWRSFGKKCSQWLDYQFRWCRRWRGDRLRRRRRFRFERRWNNRLNRLLSRLRLLRVSSANMFV